MHVDAAVPGSNHRVLTGTCEQEKRNHIHTRAHMHKHTHVCVILAVPQKHLHATLCLGVPYLLSPISVLVSFY